MQSWKIPDVISELLNKGGSPSYGCESMEVFVSKLIERGCAVDSENQKSPILWGEMFKRCVVLVAFVLQIKYICIVTYRTCACLYFRIIGFGPGSSKENILVDHTSGHNFCNSAWLKPGALQSRKTYRDASNDLGQFLESVRSGFDLAVSKGPLCEEQVTGLCFVLKEFTTNGDTTDGLIGYIDSGSMAM